MALASTSDVNLHLPEDKAQATDEELVELHIDAQRLIRSRLGSTVAASIMNTWTTPATTPDIIRHIAGLIAAAKFYAKLVAEDEADGSLYAQNLLDQAYMEIDKILTGATVIIGVDDLPIVLDVSTDLRFYPDGAAPDPSFQVAQVWS